MMVAPSIAMMVPGQIGGRAGSLAAARVCSTSRALASRARAHHRAPSHPRVAGQRRAVGTWWNVAAAAASPWTASRLTPRVFARRWQRPRSMAVATAAQLPFCGGALRWRSARGGVGAGGSATVVRASGGGRGGGGRGGDGAFPAAVFPSHCVTPGGRLISAKSRRPHQVLLPPLIGRLGADVRGVLPRQLAWCARQGTSPSPAPSSAPCALRCCRRVAESSAQRGGACRVASVPRRWMARVERWGCLEGGPSSRRWCGRV